MNKRKYTVYCNPDENNFNWEKPFDLKNLPNKLKQYDRVKVEFSKYIPQKSLSQLGFYRGGILPFIEKERWIEQGMIAKEWHDVFKDRFGERKRDKTGSFEIILSHADYTEEQMSLFIQKVIGFCWEEFRLTIPPANNIEDYI